MNGNDVRGPDRQALLDAAAREVDDLLDDAEGELPDQLDVPIETPVDDALESIQSAGEFDDDYEPHD